MIQKKCQSALARYAHTQRSCKVLVEVRSLKVRGVECHEAEDTGDKTSDRKGKNLSRVRKRQSKKYFEKTYPSREDEGNLAPVHSAKIVVHQGNADG